MVIKKSLILLFLFFSLGVNAIIPQPKIPKKNIPIDIPQEIRKNILKLYSSDPIIRADGARLLGAMGKKAQEAVPYLIANLQDDYNLEWRTTDKNPNPFKKGDFLSYTSPGNEAALALGKIGDSRAVLPLIKALKKGYRNAALSLGMLKDKRAIFPLISELNSKSWSFRGAVAAALGNIGEIRATIPLINALKKKDWIDSADRWLAVEALGKIKDPRAVDILISIVNKNDLAFGWYAVEALGNFNTPRAIEALVNELRKNNSNRAFSALARHKNPIMIKPLIQMLTNNSYQARINAAKLLGIMKNPQAIQKLEQAVLRDIDCNVKEAATNALGNIGEPATKSLIKILKTKPPDEYCDCRGTAALQLGKVGDVISIAPLIETLNDSGPDEEAAEALESIGPPAIESLIIALKDKRINVKNKAAAILGNIKDPRAIKPLIKALSDKSLNTSAALSLSKITGKKFNTDSFTWNLWLFWQKKKNRVITFICIGILVIITITRICRRMKGIR